MFLLHNIGERVNSNYNTHAEVADCHGPISFDGVYRNVFENRYLLAGRDSYLFVMGSYVGGDNAFDIGMPREHYCSWEEVFALTRLYKCKLGWHTWTHRDLTKLPDDVVVTEITPPFPMKYFAYPYGTVDERVAKLVQDAGYEAAWCAGPHGDGTQFQKRRWYLNW